MSDRMGEEVARNAETLAAVQAAYERYAETLVAEWWCALCPTSHPTRAALDKHTAAGHPTSMIGTSARLRQLQQDLAASQAELTRVERERDEALDRMGFRAVQLQGSRELLAVAQAERDLARAELAAALDEIDVLTHSEDAGHAITKAEVEQLRARINELESKEP